MDRQKQLNPLKVGAIVRCRDCGRVKAPRGRSVAVLAAAFYCTLDECDGYSQEPHAGSLWPRESETEFGWGVGEIGVMYLNGQAEGE